jgi:hypothetical protein
MTLTQLVLDERRSSTGIRNWSVRSSLDSFASDLHEFSVPDNDSTRTGQTINLSSLFADVAEGIEFRVYGYAAEASGGTWRIDNVKLEGSVQPVLAVPDGGSSAILLALPLLGLWTLRRLSTRTV